MSNVGHTEHSREILLDYKMTSGSVLMKVLKLRVLTITVTFKIEKLILCQHNMFDNTV